jgi:hypothetical protein
LRRPRWGGRGVPDAAVGGPLRLFVFGRQGREGPRRGRVQRKWVVIAHGVHETGLREIIALDVGAAETEPFWSEFLRSLVARGLVGVQLVVSDAHERLGNGIAKVLGAPWQRCTVRLLMELPRSSPCLSSRGSCPASRLATAPSRRRIRTTRSTAPSSLKSRLPSRGPAGLDPPRKDRSGSAGHRGPADRAKGDLRETTGALSDPHLAAVRTSGAGCRHPFASTNRKASCDHCRTVKSSEWSITSAGAFPAARRSARPAPRMPSARRLRLREHQLRGENPLQGRLHRRP